MKSNSEHIKLYEYRTLGNKVNTVFDFIHENWRGWLRLSIYILLPVSIVASIGIVNLITTYFSGNNDSAEDIKTTMWVSTYAVMAIGFMIANTTFLALMRYYFTHDGGLDTATFADIRKEITPMLGKMLVIAFMVFAIAIPFSMVSLFTFLFAPIVFLFYWAMVVNPLMMAPAVVAFENNRGLWDCILHAFKLCYDEFWKMMGLMIVMALLYVYSQAFIGGVWTIATILLSTYTNDSETIANAMAGGTLLYYIITVGATLIQFYAYSVVVMAIAFHYGSVSQSKEDADLESAINNFENL